jgi:hypothetical protein
MTDDRDPVLEHHHMSLEVHLPSLAGAPSFDAVVDAFQEVVREVQELCELLAELQGGGWRVDSIVDGEVRLETADPITQRQLFEMVARLPDGLQELAREGLCWPGCAEG